MKKFIGVVTTLVISVGMVMAQGGPPGGGPPGGGPPGGWPPNCPTCPPDPTAVPIGDWKWQLGLIICALFMGWYMMNKKEKLTQNQES